MNEINKYDSEILRQKAVELLNEKSEAKILELIEELAFQNKEKTKRADELLIANKELAFQNEEKAKRADELLIANKELAFQNEEKAKRADELLIANKELAFQNEEKAKRAYELLIASKELAFQLEEKAKRAKELIITNKELAFQTELNFANNTALKLTRNLELQQIELEMQNKELSLANDHAIADAHNYTNLYDYAPSGNFTLSNEGTIIGLNFSGATMLGKDRSKLISNRFGIFVSNDTRSIFNQFLDEVFSSRVNKACDVTLSAMGNTPMYVHLTGIVAQNGNECVVTVVDITDSRLVTALKLSEQRFYYLFDKANEGLILLTMDGKIAEVNQSFAMMHGYTVSELKNMDIRDLDVLRESAFESRAEVMRRINEGEVVRFEVEHYHKDGHSIMLSNTVSLITIGDQKFYLAFHQDITERKQTEIALQKSEELYRKLLHTIPDIIVMTDIEGNITFASDKMDSFLDNVPKENIYGKNMLSFIAEHDLPRAIENTRLMFNNALGVREYQLKFPNNMIFDAEINGDIIRDRENNPLGIVFVIRNITERKRLEEEKRITDSKILTLSMAIEQSPVTTVMTDLAGNIEFMNPMFTQTTGYTAQEAIGKNHRILKTDNKTRSECKELWDTILSGQTWHGVFQNKKKNGELYWESAVISPVRDNEGTITHFIAVKENITERMKSEAALIKAKAEAEAASKSKSTFLANMSHEIRTPLNAIIGFSQLMNREKSLVDTQKEYVTSINRAGEHLLKLINNILELSKIESGRAELNPTNFKFQTLLNDMQMMLNEWVKSKQIQLIFETSADLPQYIVADEQKLRQIFINLIGNAIKFTDNGGVTVRTRVDKANDETSLLIVEIEDTGPGIPEDELGKLFKQFEQTRAGIESSSGTGLGLALSQELALLMNGNITVASQEGKGSVFTVNVEIKEGTPEAGETVITRQVTGIDNPQETYRILVVDDKEENRQVVVNFLQLVGFQTNEAINGQDAIAKFEQWNPHLILMDMRMPVMDGYEATRRIKATEKGKQTPVIAVTASSPEDEKNKNFALEIEGYVRKPFHENELFSAIGKALGIEYIYEEEKTTPPPSKYQNNEKAITEDIAKLPDELAFQMLEAVEVADFHLLIQLIKTIGNENAELATHLMSKANNYDYDFFMKLLIPKISKNGK